MKLPSDYRISQSRPGQVDVVSALAWEKLREYLTPPAPKFKPSTWVKVFNPPTAFSFDEAWLLCQCSDDEWLAWIPDYGEILLRTDEFVNLAE